MNYGNLIVLSTNRHKNKHFKNNRSSALTESVIGPYNDSNNEYKVIIYNMAIHEPTSFLELHGAVIALMIHYEAFYLMIQSYFSMSSCGVTELYRLSAL